jgi:excisionase family DNA binding protein
MSDVMQSKDEITEAGMPPHEKLLRKKEAASLLAVSSRTIDRLVSLGRLTRVKVLGGVRFRISEVAEKKGRESFAEKQSEAAGILEPKVIRDAAGKPLKEHLEDYVADLERRGRSGRGGRGARLLKGRLVRLMKDCGWKLAIQVTPDSFTAWRNQMKGLAGRRVVLAKFVAHRHKDVQNKAKKPVGVVNLYEVQCTDGKAPTVQTWGPRSVQTLEAAAKECPCTFKEGQKLVVEFDLMEPNGLDAILVREVCTGAVN